MDSRLSGIERLIYFFRRENKENFILMYSRISVLVLGVRILGVSIRREY